MVVLAENAMLQVEKRRSMTGKAPAVESANFGFLARHDVQLVRLGALAERYFGDYPNTTFIM